MPASPAPPVVEKCFPGQEQSFPRNGLHCEGSLGDDRIKLLVACGLRVGYVPMGAVFIA